MPSSAGSQGGQAADALYRELDTLFADRDRAGAVAAALDAVVGERVSIPELYARVLGPLLVAEGARWQAGELAVWEEHFGTATVRTIVEALYPEVVRRSAAVEPRGRTAILACPTQEYHELALRMLADRLQLAGWRVYFLGADTPEIEIVDAARRLGADTVVLSAATHFHRVNLRAFVDHIEAELPGTHVYVGGPAFERDRSGWSADELIDAGALLGEEDGA